MQGQLKNILIMHTLGSPLVVCNKINLFCKGSTVIALDLDNKINQVYNFSISSVLLQFFGDIVKWTSRYYRGNKIYDLIRFYFKRSKFTFINTCPESQTSLKL